MHTPAMARSSFRGCGCRCEADRRGAVASGEEEEEEAASSSAAGARGEEETGNEALNLTQLLAKVVANPAFYLVGGLAMVKIVGQADDSFLPTVLLSASPVVLLTLLSKSDAGKRVQDELEARLPELQREAETAARARTGARERSVYFGANRTRFLGPLDYDYPEHLDGSLPGDVGFDPLGFGRDPGVLARMQELELLHARWAMLAALGCLVPELLPDGAVAEPRWFNVGAAKLNADITFDYLGIEGFRIAGKQGLLVIVMCQLALMGGPEYARYVGIESLQPVGIFLPGDRNWPGGALFDPLNLAADPDESVRLQVSELKHGRLAMLAMLGYAFQAIACGGEEGPVGNLRSALAAMRG